MAHGNVIGRHTHEHQAYGSQAGDAHHEHMHSHSGDSNHRHHAEAAASYPFGTASFIAAVDADGSALVAADTLTDVGSATLRHVLSLIATADNSVDEAQQVLSEYMGVKNPDDDYDDGDSGMAMLGASWGARLVDRRWKVLTADGSAWDGNPPGRDVGIFEPDGSHVSTWSPPGFETYTEAVAAIAEQMATLPADRPVLSTTWRSDMAFETVDTGDGRYIRDGAIEYRNTPLPLMLQTQTAGGHLGAVLAGTIEKTGKLGTTALGSGTYDATDAGRQFAQIVAARGRFGVSIDVAEADGEVVCTARDDDGDCSDYRVEFSKIRIMGLTGTPFPAFENAFIESVEAAQEQAQAAAGNTVHFSFGNRTTGPASTTWTGTFQQPEAVTAAAYPTPVRPPAAWFDDPQFAPDDGRTVRQPDGQWLCPLTVTPDGEVYGHFAGWMSCHTGFTNTCIRPPRSRTGYAAFHLRPLETAEGEIVSSGQIVMGCGHIPDDGSLSVEKVRAFYDGGPGAIQVARVRCGEDAHGGWFHGALCDGLSDQQVRKFASLSVSGHWKEVWRGKGLDLVACAAGIVVPGFTITSMAAAGFKLDVDDRFRLPEPVAHFHDGRVVALVAAGAVRQPMPWERALATSDARVDRLERRLEAAERITSQLRRQVAEELRTATLPAAAES